MVSLNSKALCGLLFALLAATTRAIPATMGTTEEEVELPQFGDFFEDVTMVSESTVTQELTETVSSTLTVGTSTSTVYEGPKVTRTVTHASSTLTVYKGSPTKTVTHTDFVPVRGHDDRHHRDHHDDHHDDHHHD